MLVAESQSGRAGRTHHVVVDPGPDSAGADLIGTAERLPIAGGAVGMVLCTQVLEHVEDPRAAVAEMACVLEPAGVCLLTTHGTWFYHPDPEDYWGWTPAGLVRLFRDSGFDQVTVRPVGGIIRALLIAPCNRILWSLLKGRVTGRQSEPGELVIDYIVTATRP